PDDCDEPVRHDVLFAGRAACVARDYRAHHAADHAGVCADREIESHARRAREGAGAVLALCRCGVGCSVHRGVHRGEMMDETTQPGTGHAGETHHGAVHATHHGTIHLPAPTMWPFLMAMGVTLIFFSLVTSPWVMW